MYRRLLTTFYGIIKRVKFKPYLLCNIWSSSLHPCLEDKLYLLCHSVSRVAPTEELPDHV